MKQTIMAMNSVGMDGGFCSGLVSGIYKTEIISYLHQEPSCWFRSIAQGVKEAQNLPQHFQRSNQYKRQRIRSQDLGRCEKWHDVDERIVIQTWGKGRL